MTIRLALVLGAWVAAGFREQVERAMAGIDVVLGCLGLVAILGLIGWVGVVVLMVR